MTITLQVQPRDSKESADVLRARGVVPAVYYGPKEAATPIAINARELESLWKQAGETTLITLSGAGEDKDTLIHDVQVHPVNGQILHADFYVIEKGKKVTINVPVEFIGQANAEKQGHIVVKSLHEIEIEVAPQEIPHNFEIDITGLENVGDQIIASDIKLPKSATLITGPEEVLVSITEFKEEKIEEPAAPAEGAEGAAPADGEAAVPAEGDAKAE